MAILNMNTIDLTIIPEEDNAIEHVVDQLVIDLGH